jgi:hypothetical protein
MTETYLCSSTSSDGIRYDSFTGPRRAFFESLGGDFSVDDIMNARDNLSKFRDSLEMVTFIPPESTHS